MSSLSRVQGSGFRIQRRPLAAICCLLSLICLTGCGFKPLYAKNTTEDPDSKLYAGVKVDPIPTHMGQELRIALEDRLNPDGDTPPNPAYRLTATINSTSGAIGVSRDGTVSRYNIYLDSHYVLYSTADGKPVLSGDLREISSYNNLTSSYFSTYISDDDAIKRGITELSEQYRLRLAAYLEEGAPMQKNIETKPPTEVNTPALTAPWPANNIQGNSVPTPPI